MKAFRKGFVAGRLHVQITYRPSDSPWGRFGGGWNWRLGFMAGGNTLIIHLLVADLRMDYQRSPR